MLPSLSNMGHNVPDDVVDEINRFIHLVIERLNPQSIILFGSHSNGSYHSWSDIDLAIISNWSTADLNGRKAKLYDLAIETECYRIDPIGYNNEEIDNYINDSFLDAIAIGNVIYNSNFRANDRSKYEQY